MTLPMSWDEWAQHDGVALAARVRKGELTAAELAQQAAAGVAKVNPALSGVVELFDDAIAAPDKNGTNLDGPFAGLPFLMKDLGPTMQGRLQEMGSLLMRGNRATADTFLTGKMRQAGLNLIGRTTTPEFGVCSSADNPAVYVTRNPWNTRVYHLRFVSRQRRDGCRRRGADRARHRWRRLDPHSGRRQRKHRAEGIARGVLDRAASVRPDGACLHTGLPVALGARHGRLRRRLPRSRARRVHAVLDVARSPTPR